MYETRTKKKQERDEKEDKILIYRNILMINKLRQREITGKRIKIDYVYPLRDTKYVCYLCNQKIKGLIIDLQNDIDIFGFRYHYIIPMLSCHRCRDPVALP